uniref:Calcium homeostasis modulator family member 2 n=1 Tax=Nothoprocta perdicaria TaxID=30464 RepID=A0A8C6ZL65_NOTPE
MAAFIAENFRFLSLFFKSKDVMIFNGLVALGTVGSEELFSVMAFHCPCSPARNYIYGLAAIGVPALALFLIGVVWNNHTWNLVAECHKRGTKNFSAAATFLLFGSIMGRAAVAPVTWSVFSLLRGEAYICALSEFVQPASLDKFPAEYGAEALARFPCKDVPANLTKKAVSPCRNAAPLSQLFGWLLIGIVAVLIFLTKCLKHCCSPLSYRQEAYWDQYRSNEDKLFRRTAEVHSRVLAHEDIPVPLISFIPPVSLLDIPNSFAVWLSYVQTPVELRRQLSVFMNLSLALSHLLFLSSNLLSSWLFIFSLLH